MVSGLMLCRNSQADWIEDRGTANMMNFPQLDRTELRGTVIRTFEGFSRFGERVDTDDKAEVR